MKLSKSFNPQLVQFKIKNTLLAEMQKLYEKKKTHYDVIIECLHKISVQKLIFYLNKKTKTQKTITK